MVFYKVMSKGKHKDSEWLPERTFGEKIHADNMVEGLKRQGRMAKIVRR